MEQSKIELAKDQLERVRFGILKGSNNSLLPISRSLIVENFLVDKNGVLWCGSEDRFPESFRSGRPFRVKLKYIKKSEKLYITVTGTCSIVPADTILDLPGAGSTSCTTFFRIRIDEARYYTKKTISAYTSFFQAINVIRFNKPAFE